MNTYTRSHSPFPSSCFSERWKKEGQSQLRNKGEMQIHQYFNHVHLFVCLFVFFDKIKIIKRNFNFITFLRLMHYHFFYFFFFMFFSITILLFFFFLKRERGSSLLPFSQRKKRTHIKKRKIYIVLIN